jgi:uncharacterized membrane protein YoaK (UPF0700 family)
VNVCALSFFHIPVSHVSGAVSGLSLNLQSLNATDSWLTIGIVGSFFAGAVCSGVLIGQKSLASGRRYGVAMVLEGLVLGAATVMLFRGNSSGVALAAFACGIQNAMASSYRGLVIRTTHMTGLVTDIGVMVGHLMRHRRVNSWKVVLLAAILLGFFLGGVAGAVSVSKLGPSSLGLASVTCLLLGVGYYGWMEIRRRAPATSSLFPEP